MNEVRKSVVRISFTMTNPKNEEDPEKYEHKNVHMVIPGIIILVDANSCEIVAGSELLAECIDGIFHLRFPTAAGYGAEFVAQPYTLGDNFSRFIVNGVDTQYVKEVQFETLPVVKSQDISTFVFPRETRMTPSGLWPGYVVDATPELIFFIDCPFHEYAPFGSPVFNVRGQLVGMCYAFQSRIHTWAVRKLKSCFDQYLDEEQSKRICYFKDGVQISGKKIGLLE